MNDLKRLERVEQALDEIRSLCESGAVLIVEGMKDKASLEELGIHGNILMVSHHALFPLADRIHDELSSRGGKDISGATANSGFSAVAVILTDWDSKGDELAERIGIYLRHRGIRVEDSIRMRIASLVRKEVYDVESLYSYLEKLRLAVGAKTVWSE